MPVQPNVRNPQEQAKYAKMYNAIYAKTVTCNICKDVKHCSSSWNRISLKKKKGLTLYKMRRKGIPNTFTQHFLQAKT